MSGTACQMKKNQSHVEKLNLGSRELYSVGTYSGVFQR